MIKNSNLLTRLSQHVFNVLGQHIHMNALRTIALLEYIILYSRTSLMSQWAYMAAVMKRQRFKNSKFVLNRFLSKSKFSVNDGFKALCDWVLEGKTGEIHVLMDWTKVRKYSVLQLAIPHKRRAVPFMYSVVDDGFLLNDTTNLELELLRLFFSFLDEETRKRVVIIADRGFAKPKIIRLLNNLGCRYIIRIPRSGSVKIRHGWEKISHLCATTDGTVYTNVIYTTENKIKTNLIIRKTFATTVNHESDDTWMLISNMNDQPHCLWGLWAGSYTKRYAKRMHIEEMFRDLKSHGFEVQKSGYKSEQTIEKILFLLQLAYLLALMVMGEHYKEEYFSLITIGRRGKQEHSIFTLAMRLWQAKILYNCISSDEADFLQTRLLINSKQRKIIELL